MERSTTAIHTDYGDATGTPFLRIIVIPFTNANHGGDAIEGKTKMANAARQAVKNAKSNVASKAPAKSVPDTGTTPAVLSEEERKVLADLRKRERDTAIELSKAFQGKVVKVVNGKKRKGETGNVTWSGPNKYGKRIARIEFGEDFDIIDQGYLEVVGDQDAKTRKRIEAANEASKNETFYIAATIGHQSEKAVRMDYPGWFKSLWFSKEMVSKTEATYGEKNTPIFEIPAWKVRKECGSDCYDALRAKQDELAALVDAAG